MRACVFMPIYLEGFGYNVTGVHSDRSGQEKSQVVKNNEALFGVVTGPIEPVSVLPLIPVLE